MIVYIYNIGVDLYNGFNGLRHRINWTYFTVLDGLAHPLYSDIKDNEKKQLSKLIFNKQNIILILIAILFSPMVIGIRFICCKINKIENRKIKAVIKVIGFVVFSSYLVSLKENVAYLLIGIFSLVYLLYQFYLSGLETK